MPHLLTLHLALLSGQDWHGFGGYCRCSSQASRCFSLAQSSPPGQGLSCLRTWTGCVLLEKYCFSSFPNVEYAHTLLSTTPRANSSIELNGTRESLSIWNTIYRRGKQCFIEKSKVTARKSLLERERKTWVQSVFHVGACCFNFVEVSTCWGFYIFCRQMNPGGDWDWNFRRLTSLLPAMGAATVCFNMRLLLLNSSRLGFPFPEITQHVWSLALFFFFPFSPSGAHFSLWCFQMARLQFCRLFLICSMHLRLTFALGYPKMPPLKLLLFWLPVFNFSHLSVGDIFAVSKGKAMWFFLLAVVGGIGYYLLLWNPQLFGGLSPGLWWEIIGLSFVTLARVSWCGRERTNYILVHIITPRYARALAETGDECTL